MEFALGYLMASGANFETIVLLIAVIFISAVV